VKEDKKPVFYPNDDGIVSGGDFNKKPGQHGECHP